VLDVDRVRDGGDEAQIGKTLALVLRDGDEDEVVTQAAEHLLRRRVGGTVQRGHDRRPDQTMDEGAHDAAVDAVVVVDDVELPGHRVGLEAVRHLQVHTVLDLLEGGAGEDCRKPRPRLGIAAREQGDLMAALDQTLREQGHDELDAAVATWRQREPWRRDHPDLHGGPSPVAASPGLCSRPDPPDCNLRARRTTVSRGGW